MNLESSTFSPILTRFGVPNDGILVVHAGISHLSRQGFRAEAMIEAFQAFLARGTLVIPTMTWRTVTPAQPYWDELATPSHTGILSELFRTKYATHRSIHPTHSAAASGTFAAELVAKHHVDPTPVSANSPYGLMRNRKAFILLLGVGLENCTAIHLPEELIAPELYVRPELETELYQCRDRHGTVHAVPTRRHYRLDRDFPKFSAPLATKGKLQAGMIGDCPFQITGLDDLLDEVTAALAGDHRATLRTNRS